MKTHIIILIVLLLVVAFPAALYAQETDPVTVVMARAEAFNAGDVDAAAAFFAEDAIYTFAEPPPNAQEVYNGREEIRGRLAGLADFNASISVEVTKVEGNNLTTLTRYTDDSLINMGVDFIEGVEEYTVEDGLITFYRWTETEESIAKIAAAMAPPETMPESGGNPGSMAAVALLLGAVLVLAGLLIWSRAAARG